jgi:16S rRNA (cytidine1402-2'-O)-methyltransferase
MVVERVIDKLQSGSDVALVSDAGTPLVSDPGYRLVKAAHAKNIPVSPIPGPSAVITAISAAGLPTDRFTFEGYLPSKQAARQTALRNLRNEERSMIFLESVHRISASLADLTTVFGAEREAFLGRELTKLHEQCVQANLGTLHQQVTDGDIVKKGEFVLVVHGAEPNKSADPTISSEDLLKELMQSLPGKQAVDITTRLTNRPRKEIYRQMLAIKNQD